MGESAFKFSEETTNILNREKLLKSSLNLLKVKELLEKYKYENLEDIIEANKISFKMLFEFLIDKNKVPIGVLRNLDGVHKFVFLAPDINTVIDVDKDEVYIISCICYNISLNKSAVSEGFSGNDHLCNTEYSNDDHRISG